MTFEEILVRPAERLGMDLPAEMEKFLVGKESMLRRT